MTTYITRSYAYGEINYLKPFLTISEASLPSVDRSNADRNRFSPKDSYSLVSPAMASLTTTFSLGSVEISANGPLDHRLGRSRTGEVEGIFLFPTGLIHA